MYIKLILFFFTTSVFCRVHENEWNHLDKIEILEKEQDSLKRRVGEREEKNNYGAPFGESRQEAILKIEERNIERQKEQESLKRRVEELEEKCNSAISSATLQVEERIMGRIKRSVHPKRKYRLGSTFLLHFL